MNTEDIIEQIDEVIENIISLTHIPQKVRDEWRHQIEDIEDELESYVSEENDENDLVDDEEN